MKKYVLIAALLCVLTAFAVGRELLGAALFLGLFVWILLETIHRQRFRFLARGRHAEQLLTLPQLHAGLVAELSPHALLVEHGSKLSLARFSDAAVEWERVFETPPQAVAIGPEGRLYYATETEVVLCDAAGKDLARLAFEAPLYRQSYRLILSKDGRGLALHTPWFVQFFAPDLSQLGQRIRYEEAGHYFKYAAMTEDGRGLLVAGALLLEDDPDSTAAMEARWDYWSADNQGQWSQVWAKAYESYNNSHLRSVAIQGSVLLAEVYQQGYEFRLYRPDGSSLWERPGGEHAVLSPDGQYLLWQNAFDEVLLSRVADKQELWKRKVEALIRLKAVDSQGRVLLVEGRRLSVFDVEGKVLWRDGFKEDPSQLSLGSRGRLLVIKEQHAGLIRVPLDV